MKKEIEDRIMELGGSFHFRGHSLQEDLKSISFKKSFLKQGFEALLTSEKYREIEIRGVVPESEIPSYPRVEFETFLFTPFKEGTEDFEEWYAGWLDEREAYVRSVIQEDFLDFLVIGYTDMTRYFICLADKKTENPTVYSIDMDMPFDEKYDGLDVDGTLEDYFNMFVSNEEYEIAITKLIENLRGK